MAVPKHELEHHETTPEEEDPTQFEVEMVVFVYIYTEGYLMLT